MPDGSSSSSAPLTSTVYPLSDQAGLSGSTRVATGIVAKR